MVKGSSRRFAPRQTLARLFNSILCTYGTRLLCLKGGMLRLQLSSLDLTL